MAATGRRTGNPVYLKYICSKARRAGTFKMAEIIPFAPPKKKKHDTPNRSVLCQNGHHRWVVWQKKPFDVKQGRLITIYRCERCGAERSEAR
jgi:hypothetical protein